MRKLTFALKSPVNLAYIAQAWLALERRRPVLHIAEDLVLDVMVQGGHLEY